MQQAIPLALFHAALKVTTVLGLAAFAAAVTYLAYLGFLRSRLETIKNLPASERSAWLDERSPILSKLDPKELTRDQVEKITLAELRRKSWRDLVLMICFVTASATSCVLLIFWQSPVPVPDRPDCITRQGDAQNGTGGVHARFTMAQTERAQGYIIVAFQCEVSPLTMAEGFLVRQTSDDHGGLCIMDSSPNRTLVAKATICRANAAALRQSIIPPDRIDHTLAAMEATASNRGR